jgi:hypothetical protein
MVHRMTKPPENQIDPKELAEKLGELETVIKALAEKLDKEIRHNANMDRLNTELRKLVENDVIDAFARIKNIELKFFPNLAGDISRLNDVIGEGDGKAWNPLDHRKP